MIYSKYVFSSYCRDTFDDPHNAQVVDKVHEEFKRVFGRRKSLNVECEYVIPSYLDK